MGGPGQPPWLSHSTWALLVMFQFSSVLLYVHSGTETVTVRTVRDGRPRTATLTFTQHLSFVSDVSVQFSVALRPQRLGWGAMDSHLDFHTACSSSKVKQLFTTMHKCSNLNELLQTTMWTEGLFTGPPPVNTPLCFTLYSVPREEIL